MLNMENVIHTSQMVERHFVLSPVPFSCS